MTAGWTATLRATKRLLEAPGEAFARFVANDGLVLAGNMAFLGMISLFPFLIFLVALSGFLGRTEAGMDAIALMLETLPEEVVDTVAEPIGGIIHNTRADLLTGSILIALWTASSGLEAARTAVIRAHGREHARAFWRRRLESIAVVVVAALLAILAMSILIAGPPIMAAVASFLLVPAEVWRLFAWLRFGLSPLMLFLAVFGLYAALTPRMPGCRRVRAPGTLLAVVVALGTATGLSIYLKYANQYDVTYGSLAGVVIAQLFCFIVSLGFILGAELNAAYARRSWRADRMDEASAPDRRDRTAD